MLNSKQIVERIRVKASEIYQDGIRASSRYRMGQAFYTAAYEVVPETLELEMVAFYDPFHDDTKIESFLKAIAQQIDKNNKDMEHPYAPNKLPAKFQFVKVYSELTYHIGYWNGDVWCQSIPSGLGTATQELANVKGWSYIK